MPDLATVVRVNMGEHGITHYRFDGKQYRPVYRHTAVFVGTDGNGNGLVVAKENERLVEVVCAGE